MRWITLVVSITAFSGFYCRSWGKFWLGEFVYAQSPLLLTQSVAMTAVTPSLPGSPSSCTASPALPDGLSLGTDCTISGTPTRGQGALPYRITADLGADTISAELSIRVYFQPKFVYSINSTAATISRFLILSNGQLSPQGSVASATQAWFGLASPDHKFLYVANKSAAQITVYTVDPTTGALAQIPSSPYSTLAAPHTLSMTPTGTILYVGHDNATVQGVTAFSVNASTGALTALNGGAAFFVASGSSPGTVAVEPAGKHLYVGSTQPASANPYAFSLSESGALTLVSGSPFATIDDAIAVAVHPSGNFVYFGQYFNAANGVRAFSRDLATGRLQSIAGSFATGSAPTNMAISANGAFLYVAPSVSNLVGFKIDSTTGVLTPTPSSPYATAGGVQGVAIDETTKYVYTANSASNDINGFVVNPATGDLLTPTPGGPYATGVAPVHIVVMGSNP